MKKLVAVIISLIFVVTLSACADDTEVITVLTSSGYEPYQMVNEQGELIGFDIDLMEAIADYLGWTIVWSDVDFDGIIASLQAGQAPLAIAGITPTPERAQMVNFSSIYFNSEEGLLNYFVYNTNNPIEGLDQLEGKVIGAQLGTIQAELITELAETYGFTVDLRNQNAQMIQEILSGRMDAVVTERLVAETIVANNTSLSLTPVDGTDSADQFGNAIAVSKSFDQLEAINDAIAALQADGTIAALVSQWFGE